MRYGQVYNAIIPSDYIEFCISDNGGGLSISNDSYKVPFGYGATLNLEGIEINLISLLGVGSNIPEIKSVTNATDLMTNHGFIELSEHWVVALGGGSDCLIMKVTREGNGQISYLYTDTGETCVIAESFTQLLEGLSESELFA